MGAFIELQHITKRYGTATVVDDVSLTLERGEIFSLLGPSGSGKTTLLRILAGFIAPDAGRVLIDGRDITALPPNERPVNTVFQNYALFPHMTIRENIGFGLEVAGLNANEITHRVNEMLELVQMQEHAGKRPSQISGGQKQRVAIARALVNKPELLLLDEPLAALDLKLRQRLLLELENIHAEVGGTFLYVTHDQGEAMSLGDRIAVMNAGKFCQIGVPAEVYEAPHTRFVAEFVGDTNLFEATVALGEDKHIVTLQTAELGTIECDLGESRRAGQVVMAAITDPVQNGQRVALSLRPERIAIRREPPPFTSEQNTVRGVVEDLSFQGSQTHYHVRVQQRLIAVSKQHRRHLPHYQPISQGEEVWLSWFSNDGHLIIHDPTTA